jgi:glyoxylase-like metal-dependent hydrolase (beta-lactamase superfamily II)
MNKNYSRRDFLNTTAGALGMLALPTTLTSNVNAQPADVEINRMERSHAWVFQSAGCNVFALPDVAGDGVLMVDGGLSAHADLLVDSVLDTFGKDRVHTLVNTLWHPEHTGANDRLGA